MKKLVVVCDHELWNVWKGADTIFCKTHMQRNIKEFLRKQKLGSRAESNPVTSVFHSLIFLYLFISLKNSTIKISEKKYQ